MPRTKFTARATPRKFYVKTTNDASQSNCKYTQEPGHGNVTIEATRIFNTGDEIKLFNDVPFYFGYSSEDDYPSDLCKKSTGDKHKQRDELDDNLRDDNDRSDLDIEQSEVSNMNLEKDFSVDGLIQEMQRKADVISVLQQELTQDIQAFRLNLELEKKSTGDKKRKERDKLDDNFRDDNDRLDLKKRKDDDKLRDDNDCSDLEKKSTGKDKRKQRDELSEDDRRFVFILDNERREFEVKIAMAKRDVVFWGKQIEEINEKEDLILGRGGELSEDDMNDIRILDFERRSYKLKIDSAGSEFEFYEEEIQGNMSILNAILGGGGMGWRDLFN